MMSVVTFPSTFHNTFTAVNIHHIFTRSKEIFGVYIQVGTTGNSIGRFCGRQNGLGACLNIICGIIYQYTCILLSDKYFLRTYQVYLLFDLSSILLGASTINVVFRFHCDQCLRAHSNIARTIHRHTATIFYRSR